FAIKFSFWRQLLLPLFIKASIKHIRVITRVCTILEDPTATCCAKLASKLRARAIVSNVLLRPSLCDSEGRFGEFGCNGECGAGKLLERPVRIGQALKIEGSLTRQFLQ